MILLTWYMGVVGSHRCGDGGRMQMIERHLPEELDEVSNLACIQR